MTDMAVNINLPRPGADVGTKKHGSRGEEQDHRGVCVSHGGAPTKAGG